MEKDNKMARKIKNLYKDTKKDINKRKLRVV